MARFPDEQIVVIDGATTTVKVAHVRLCHSRMLFVRAYPRETQDALGTSLRNALPGRGWCLTHTTRRSPSSVEPASGASKTAGIVRHLSRELPVRRHWFEPTGDGREDRGGHDFRRPRQGLKSPDQGCKVPAKKSVDSFDFKAIPKLNKMQVLVLQCFTRRRPRRERSRRAMLGKSVPPRARPAGRWHSTAQGGWQGGAVV